jgi:hypothetical protein
LIGLPPGEGISVHDQKRLLPLMGGYSPGRRNGGPVVEDGLRLDLAHCIRKGLIRPGSYAAGTIQWTLTRTGLERANISYVPNLVDPADAWVRLIYTSTTRSTGAKRDNSYHVRLETTRPNFGGLRWWFLCPVTGRRVVVLYLPGKGGTVFASRQASGLAYRSQRASPEDRVVERSLKARTKLGVADQNMLNMPYCPRPKWMRRRTQRVTARAPARSDAST